MRRLTPDLLTSQDAPRTLGTRASSPIVMAGEAEAANLRMREQQSAFAEARERGFAEGGRDAERELERRVEAIATQMRQEHSAELAKLTQERSQLQQLSLGLVGALTEYAGNAESTATEVAYAAVLRLLGEKAVERTLMNELCRLIVREFGHPPATLRVSESDLPLLDTNALSIPVEADRRLQPGQCVIDSARGQVESGLDVRLEALRVALLAGLAEHRSAA